MQGRLIFLVISNSMDLWILSYTPGYNPMLLCFVAQVILALATRNGVCVFKLARTCCPSCVCMLSCVRLFVTHQAPLSMEFSRQEYWSGLPFPSPGDFPDPGIESGSLTLQAVSLLSELPGKPT